MITINAIMKVDAAQRNNYLALIEPLKRASNQEAGALYYEHFENTDEPNTFAFIERYKDGQALEAHNQSEHFQQFFSEVKQYLVEEPEIKVLSSN
ncbi:putative quinol monooxygenase [Staphylococcus saprophyticus]|nr:putative quinol monooxygenase [Staphylococcus saprophyticus]MDW4220910.1 putative quinol monooxygenase [Staphylococcus saprophyticus]